MVKLMSNPGPAQWEQHSTNRQTNERQQLISAPTNPGRKNRALPNLQLGLIRTTPIVVTATLWP